MQSSDSTVKGYLQPTNTTVQDDPLWDFFHDLIVNVLNLDPTLVRPRWQSESANVPEYDTDWCAFDIEYQQIVAYPALIGNPENLDQYLYQVHESFQLFCTFYGSNAGKNASLFRDNLFIDQVRDDLTEAGIGFIEAERIITVPQLDFNNRWWSAADIRIDFVRVIERFYSIKPLLSAEGIIISNSSASSDFNTDREI